MQSAFWNALDLLLAVLLLGLGWAAVSSRDVRRGVVLFIAFGLLLALAWARLRAPDLALAEAAIGAGLSGALLLAALRDQPRPGSESHPGAKVSPRPSTWLLVPLTLALAAAFAWALVQAVSSADPARLAGRVASQLPASGVSNPVTAVLLNFRAYDTLLELAVLMAAVLGILALGPARPPYRAPGPLLGGLIGWLVPLLIVTAGYLLWAGAHAPGGAFQAGAVLAAAAVLLRLGGHANAGLPAPAALRWVLATGVGVFLAVGLAVTLSGLAFLQYPRAWASLLIVLIESAATLSIAATLALAYLGGRPVGWERGDTPQSLTDKKEHR
jgi:multisubunit Na+/H+ antiporter MnhB subunit